VVTILAARERVERGRKESKIWRQQDSKSYDKTSSIDMSLCDVLDKIVDKHAVDSSVLVLLVEVEGKSVSGMYHIASLKTR
jgi:hypothetical protein